MHSGGICPVTARGDPRDVLGLVTSVATVVGGSAVTLSSGRSYRPDGLLLGQSFGNGLNELRQYDTQGRLTYQSLGTADTRLYSYDANGNQIGRASCRERVLRRV